MIGVPASRDRAGWRTGRTGTERRGATARVAANDRIVATDRAVATEGARLYWDSSGRIAWADEFLKAAG
ncbi:MAG TPA: hypothetical protein V6C50_00660 [Crinalium sp.]